MHKLLEPTPTSAFPAGYVQSLRQSFVKSPLRSDDLDNPAYLRQGLAPSRQVLQIALTQPNRFDQMVESGLPLQRYPALLTQFLDRSTHAADIDSSLATFRKGGASIQNHHIFTAGLRLNAKDFLTVLKHTDGLQAPSTTNTIAHVLARRPSLAPEVYRSTTVAPFATRLTRCVDSLLPESSPARGLPSPAAPSPTAPSAQRPIEAPAINF